jgi:predicted phage baseplate assembly protein
MTGCGCDPLDPEPPVVANPPGQPALRWQVAGHTAALARMRAHLAADPQPAVQALARHGSDDPGVALLDTWAVVTDIVSFYTERIAQEGFLRTATELRSVRELARTLGYELRPGVAASAELAFTLEDSTGSPAQSTIPAGTPVRTIPGQDQLPQTFETSQDLLARGVWNAVAATDGQPQSLNFVAGDLWLRGIGLGVRQGDPLLIVGTERLGYAQPSEGTGPPTGKERWDLRIVDSVTENPVGQPGWTLLETHSARPAPNSNSNSNSAPAADRTGVIATGATVFTFAERANVFGWNAPDPALLTGLDHRPPPGSSNGDWNDFQVGEGTDQNGVVELDGDHPRLRGTAVAATVQDAAWLVLQSPTRCEVYRALQVVPGGATRYALTGRTTSVKVDISEGLTGFGRGETLVLCQPRALPAAEAPAEAVSGTALNLVATDPLLPTGRQILITGEAHAPVAGSTVDPAAAARPACEPAVVLTCAPSGDGVMTVTLDHPLPTPIAAQTLRVLGNAVEATHGETVQQVLGSGDGRTPFQQVRPNRAPLTYVPDTSASGATSTMQLRVDGVAWTETPSLETAGPHDRAYVVQHDEDGAVRLVIGDGVHGARASTGVDNIVATYRVGIGADGAASASQLSLLPHRPLGVRTVGNPAPAHDWAAPETLRQARRNAPLRIRTLDRAVSVADHEDFAAAFAGVGTARADEVWDGHTDIVVVTLLGETGSQVSDRLIRNLGAALAAARDPGIPLHLLGGVLVWFGVRVELRIDPAYRRPVVEQAVRDALDARLAPGDGVFARPVMAARVLVWVRAVPGVVACTMPRLLPLPRFSPNSAAGPPTLPADETAAEVLAALPARFEAGSVLPAQLLALAPGGVDLGVMGP